jgi:hypothetical protein
MSHGDKKSNRKGDIPIMMDANTVRQLKRGEIPLGAVRLFTVEELHKLRRRPIKWPEILNMFRDRRTLQYLRVVPRHEVRTNVTTGEWAIVVDMMQWFDQLPLSQRVQMYFCFDGGKFGPCCLTRLAMGQRQATEVATAVMKRLLDFAKPNVNVDFAADNVRFVGKREDVTAAFCEFAERCRCVGAQMNEITADDARRPEAVERLLTQEYDFLGEHYDHRDNTMSSTEKTMKKLNATWSGRNSWTNRGFATHFGVLLYASSTARIELYRYHSALRHFAAVASRMQANPDMWDLPMTQLSPGVEKEMCEWTNAVLINEHVPIPRMDAMTCTQMICMDSSGLGTSACHVDFRTGAMAAFQERWTSESGLLGAGSTETEPAGVLRAAYKFIKPSFTGACLILTDHKPLVSSDVRGYAKCRAYNEMTRRLRRDFKCRFVWQHTAGVTHPMDPGSRFVSEPDPRVVGAQAIALIGSLKAEASTRTFGAPLPRPL